MQSSPLLNLTGWQRAQTEATLLTFYTTIRAGMVRLSDGGGPFGFDITAALLIDDLMSLFQCDAIIETGCFLGDTTDYLARRYPALPVYACDIDAQHAGFTHRRLAGLSNAYVECLDSPLLIRSVSFDRPLYFLDAHWGENWPLLEELAGITCGVTVIHDFDIGHPRFGFDTYQGVACGPQMLALLPDPPQVYLNRSDFLGDPEASMIVLAEGRITRDASPQEV
ncbi:hypothetical protein, partial [Nonomuraea sp. NPDC005692]|uniref:hypothetical protein n=1 Tax=Nonomuraea sp. NPDC005692 TaxID=3157168 RepID=UPI0033D90B81